MLKILKILIFLLVFITFSSNVSAQDISTKYKVEYNVTDNNGTAETKVKLNVQLTNLKSGIFVKQFSISFPKTFIIHNLIVSDDHANINPVLTSDDTSNKIDMELNDANIGRNAINNLYLEFNQDNLFKTIGNIWEVMIPMVNDKTSTDYIITVNLPVNSNKKISIAKPVPDENNGKQLTWNNPKTKTIYAVFGNKQYYQANLTYHLQNPKLTPVYTDIAFIPDTTYQKIYLEGINPKPDLVFSDEDGNYLGRYYLNPKDKKTVVFKAMIELFSTPREDKRLVFSNLYLQQKNYLLTNNQYWQIDKIPNFQYHSLIDIYDYVVDTLKYDYKKVGNNTRINANKILQQPNQSVCLQYSDLFIAIAREKGYPTRELEGYAYANDSKFRPLSLSSDILHSWPEYYNVNENLWVAIDPTWESTSGIDYYSSLDLNHIVFVIHGKKPDYPLAAGMYKTENSQDISIKSIANNSQEIIKPEIISIKYAKSINNKNTYKGKITLINKGNVYLNNAKITFNSKIIKVIPEEFSINQLAPMETKEISFNYSTDSDIYNKNANMDILLNGNKLYALSFSVFPYFFDIGLKFVIILLIILTIFFTGKLLFKR